MRERIHAHLLPENLFLLNYAIAFFVYSGIGSDSPSVTTHQHVMGIFKNMQLVFFNTLCAILPLRKKIDFKLPAAFLFLLGVPDFLPFKV